MSKEHKVLGRISYYPRPAKTLSLLCVSDIAHPNGMTRLHEAETLMRRAHTGRWRRPRGKVLVELKEFSKSLTKRSKMANIMKLISL